MKPSIETFSIYEQTKSNGIILLIIDDEIILDFVHEMLNSLGYLVISFINSRDAFECYNNIWKEVDLVFVDLVTQSSKGIETIDALYSINPNENILLASGVIPEDNNHIYTYIQRVFDARIENHKKDIQFIEKPYRMSVLSDKINEMTRLKLHGAQQKKAIYLRS